MQFLFLARLSERQILYLHGQIISLKAQIKIWAYCSQRTRHFVESAFQGALCHKGHRHKGLKGTCDFLSQRSKARLQSYSGMQH